MQIHFVALTVVGYRREKRHGGHLGAMRLIGGQATQGQGDAFSARLLFLRKSSMASSQVSWDDSSLGFPVYYVIICTGDKRYKFRSEVIYDPYQIKIAQFHVLS